jgi:hypothetical protein
MRGWARCSFVLHNLAYTSPSRSSELFYGSTDIARRETKKQSVFILTESKFTGCVNRHEPPDHHKDKPSRG